MLGTNDAKNDFDKKQFKNDYIELVNLFKNLQSKPQVYITIPPPMYENKRHFWPEVMNTFIPKMIPEIAEQSGIPQDHIINVFDALGGGAYEKNALLCATKTAHGGQPCDGIHPDDKAMEIIALTI